MSNVEISCDHIGMHQELEWQRLKNSAWRDDSILDLQWPVDSTCVQASHRRSGATGFLSHQSSVVEHFPLDVGYGSNNNSQQHRVKVSLTRKHRSGEDITKTPRSNQRLQHNLLTSHSQESYLDSKQFREHDSRRLTDTKPAIANPFSEGWNSQGASNPPTLARYKGLCD